MIKRRAHRVTPAARSNEARHPLPVSILVNPPGFAASSETKQENAEWLVIGQTADTRPLPPTKKIYAMRDAPSHRGGKHRPDLRLPLGAKKQLAEGV